MRHVFTNKPLNEKYLRHKPKEHFQPNNKIDTIVRKDEIIENTRLDILLNMHSFSYFFNILLTLLDTDI